MTNSTEVSNIIRQHSRSFSTAALFLPRQVRGNVTKLYAWCRCCDDAVDAADSPESARTQWQVLREDVDRVFCGDTPLHPSSLMLSQLVLNCGLQRSMALDLLHGMEMDLGEMKVASRAELLTYCYHAAGVVGLMMCRVMGVRDQQAHTHAKSLGIAMQLTNIARDVREDGERGRCYLPGLKEIAAATDAEVAQEVEDLLELADQHYRHAYDGINYLPRGCRIAILVAAAVYREIGNEIRRSRCDVRRGRIVVPVWRFLLTAIAAICYGIPRLIPSAPKPSSFLSNQNLMPLELTMSNPRYIAYLGVSLTSFMAAALFMLVYINPKESSYTWLPLVYAAISVVVGIGTNLIAKHYEQQVARVPVRKRK